MLTISKEANTKELNDINLKASDIDFELKPSKCVYLFFNGTKFLPSGIQAGGITKTIFNGPTKFLGKLIAVSVHSTKAAAGKAIFGKFMDLL